MEGLELIAKMSGALALILGLMFMVVFLLKRFGLAGEARGKGFIEILENKAILPKRHISLVRVAGSYFLIGSTEQGITLLGSIDSDKLGDFGHILSRQIEGDEEAGGES